MRVSTRQNAGPMPPSLPAVKTLFALSGNVCAYRGCEVKLTDPAWTKVNADVAHIRGEKPGAARSDPLMTDAERDSRRSCRSIGSPS